MFQYSSYYSMGLFRLLVLQSFFKDVVKNTFFREWAIDPLLNLQPGRPGSLLLGLPYLTGGIPVLRRQILAFRPCLLALPSKNHEDIDIGIAIELSMPQIIVQHGRHCSRFYCHIPFGKMQETYTSFNPILLLFKVL